MVASRALFAQEEVMNVRKVAVEWSSELGVAWHELEHVIVSAALNGEFDDPTGRHGFYVKDPDTKRVYSTQGKSVCDALAGPQFDYRLQFGKDCQLFAIHRDAVLAFAEKRRLSAPSWWVPETSPLPQKRSISRRELDRFLSDTADGRLTEKELRERAGQHFADNTIPRQVWRNAFRIVPKDKKRPIGISRARTQS